VKGRPSAWQRVGAPEARLGTRRPRQLATPWDLERYGMTELEELMVLAEKAEAAGGAPDWTVAEVIALKRLWGKQDGVRGGR